MNKKTYEEGRSEGLEQGRLEGRVDHHEKRLNGHQLRIDGQSRRLRMLERVIWVVGGIGVAIQYYPIVAKVMEGMAK